MATLEFKSFSHVIVTRPSCPLPIPSGRAIHDGLVWLPVLGPRWVGIRTTAALRITLGTCAGSALRAERPAGRSVFDAAIGWAAGTWLRRSSPVMKLSLNAGDGTFCRGARRRGSATSHTLSALYVMTHMRCVLVKS